uniref:RNA-dependent RNA polymerase n=1 Tax=Soybean thrips sobemo-like virus 5 TaxID=2796569 RepID=A0A7T3UYM2_9VIRU|nr:RNA-dependent RNA polymerase [Soybean thrips sobemo-like virus 5]
MEPYVDFLAKESRIYVRKNFPERYPWNKDVSLMEDLAKEYDWPDLGHVAEIRSLTKHLPLRDSVAVDTIDPDQRVIVEEEVTKLASAALTVLPHDFMSRSHFDRVIADLDMNSSPGFPYLYEYTTNKEFFGARDGVKDEARVEAVWSKVLSRIQARDSDPIRLFIKPEPHKKKKLVEGRLRLISSVSIIDQIIDQMIFGDQNEAFLQAYHYTPVKVGWSWMNGGWREVPRQNMLACDKSSWDWTVSAWLLDLELMIRSNLIVSEFKPYWLELARWRYKCLFVDNIFVTSGGLVFRVKKAGLMKSGCVNTIVTNSLLQLVLHVRVSLELGREITNIWAMGDDTLQPDVAWGDDYVRRLRKYCILKETNRVSEFAGFRWQGNFIEPLYRAKHAFNILHVKPKDFDVFALSYNLLYWRSSLLGEIQRLFPVPDIGFSRIWNGE